VEKKMGGGAIFLFTQTATPRSGSRGRAEVRSIDREPDSKEKKEDGFESPFRLASTTGIEGKGRIPPRKEKRDVSGKEPLSVVQGMRSLFSSLLLGDLPAIKKGVSFVFTPHAAELASLYANRKGLSATIV